MLNLKLNKDDLICLQVDANQNHILMLGGLHIQITKQQLEEIQDQIVLSKGFGDGAFSIVLDRRAAGGGGGSGKGLND